MPDFRGPYRPAIQRAIRANLYIVADLNGSNGMDSGPTGINGGGISSE